MTAFPRFLQALEEVPGGVWKMEVRRRWTSRNGRLRLTEVTESWSRRSTVEAAVIWSSVQDKEGRSDLVKLEEAVKEVYEDLKTLRHYEAEGLAGEEPSLRSSQFHYYPDKDILQLALETFSVQRKGLVCGSSPGVGASRLAHRGHPGQGQDLGSKAERSRHRQAPEGVGLSRGGAQGKNSPRSGKRGALGGLFCLCQKGKEK